MLAGSLRSQSCIHLGAAKAEKDLRKERRKGKCNGDKGPRGLRRAREKPVTKLHSNQEFI